MDGKSLASETLSLNGSLYYELPLARRLSLPGVLICRLHARTLSKHFENIQVSSTNDTAYDCHMI
jgi:hypothetical protein